MIEWTKPLLSATDAAPAELVLHLKNRGTEPAADSFTVSIMPGGIAEVVGDATHSYTLAPGEEKVVRFQVRVIPEVAAKAGGKTIRVGVTRSAVGTGRRPAAIVMKVDNTTPVAPQRLIEYSSWLPEQIPGQPNDTMWPAFVPKD
jgi:hypothetical protein